MRKGFLDQMDPYKKIIEKLDQLYLEKEIVGEPNDVLVRQPNQDRLYDHNGKVLDEDYIENLKLKNKVKDLTKKIDYNVLSSMVIETSPRYTDVDDHNQILSTQDSASLNELALKKF